MAALRIGQRSLDSLGALVRKHLDNNRRFQQEFYGKLISIDYAYSMYKQSQQASTDGSGTDIVHGEVEAGIYKDDFTIPIVISQVDSFVGYLSDVYLSGYPFFPVVSTPKNIKEAEMLESVIDNHSIMGQWGRQLLLFFRNGIKYNFAPLYIEWDALPMYQASFSVQAPTKERKIDRNLYFYNKITAGDPYNTVYDHTLNPADVALHGDHIGEVSMISRMALKRLLNYYQIRQTGYQFGKGSSKMIAINSFASYYVDRPQISDFVSTSARKNTGPVNWSRWLESSKAGELPRSQVLCEGIYERVKMYVRIIPKDHEITNVPNPNTPQIWKIDAIGPNVIICAEPVYTALDVLPGMIAQPLEDQFGLQTKSIAENNIGFQEQASKLINIRFAGSRRAIAGREFYDPSMIAMSDINAKTPAPKIPVRIPLASQKKVGDAIHSAPYDNNATETIVRDAQQVIQFSQMLYGTNNPTQGVFQKGNKSRAEWDDTMNFTMNRLRIPALTIEQQAMLPIKENIKWNLFQYREGGVFSNLNTGEPYEVDDQAWESMIKAALAMKISDGMTPSSKIVNPELITAGMQLISTSPILQATYGMSLPGMFAHMMSLGGVKNLDQYGPENGTTKPLPLPVQQLLGLNQQPGPETPPTGAPPSGAQNG